MARTRRVGILTAGGDSPGLNAAIRGLGKAALSRHGMEVIGFRDGFRGLAENRSVRMNRTALSGILTIGGTILGTSRDKPHRMLVDGVIVDMTPAIVENYRKNRLDALVCLGGGGTAKNALRLAKAGLNVITLPKTIDNDVAMTDATFGFDTALEHRHRGHRSPAQHGPQPPPHHRRGGHGPPGRLADAGRRDRRRGRRDPDPGDPLLDRSHRRRDRRADPPWVELQHRRGRRRCPRCRRRCHVRRGGGQGRGARTLEEKVAAKAEVAAVDAAHAGNTLRLAHQLEQLTGLESRVSILGYIQRGGTPSPVDRLLATRLGTAGADLIAEGTFGVMVAARGEGTEPVPLDQVAGRRKTVPHDHSWVIAARHVGTCLGD